MDSLSNTVGMVRSNGVRLLQSLVLRPLPSRCLRNSAAYLYATLCFSTGYRNQDRGFIHPFSRKVNCGSGAVCSIHGIAQRSRDYFDVLGVSRNATFSEIKEAYFNLSKSLHRDANKEDPDAASKFQEVQEAYKELLKPSSTLQTYIVEVEPPESKATHADLDQWYKTFLPPATIDTEAPRIVHCYHNVLTGFAVQMSPEDMKAMETKPGFLSARPEEIYKLY